MINVGLLVGLFIWIFQSDYALNGPRNKSECQWLGLEDVTLSYRNSMQWQKRKEASRVEVRNRGLGSYMLDGGDVDRFLLEYHFISYLGDINLGPRDYMFINSFNSALHKTFDFNSSVLEMVVSQCKLKSYVEPRLPPGF